MKSKISKAHLKKARLELYKKLDAAEQQGRICTARASHKALMARLKLASDGKKDKL